MVQVKRAGAFKVKALLLGSLALAGLLGLLFFQPASAQTPGPQPTPTIDRLAIPVLPENPSPEQRGNSVYYYHCMPCHGDYGQGLTDEFRQIWVEDHQNCWGRGCHGGREKDEGFPLPRAIPAVIAGETSLQRFTGPKGLLAYLKATHPPQRPGALEDGEYQDVVAFLDAENRRLAAAPQGNAAALIPAAGILLILATILIVSALLEAAAQPTPEISRVNRPPAAAQASYDRMSRWYDQLAGGSEAGLVRQGVALLAVQPNETVLDLGAGTGAALPALAGQAKLAIGADLSWGMLRMAQRRLGGNRIAALAQTNALRLPLADGCLDVILMSFTLELFDTPDMPRLLAECRRALKPGGRLCVVAMSKSRPSPLLGLYEWAHRRWPQWVDCRPIFARRALADAGFEITTAIETDTWGLPVEIVAARAK